MRFGVQVFVPLRSGSADEALTDAVATARLAERLGFDTVWVSEHHFTRWNLCTNPLLLLSHLAGITDRIRLGTSVVSLPLHHPLAVAENAALVDNLSGGRLDLGVGKGFASSDYARFGIHGDIGDLFARSRGELVSALAREDMGPGCLQQPTPPMWLAVSKNVESLDVAAEHGYGLLQAATSDQLVSNVSRYRSGWQAHQPSRPCNIALTRAVHVADSADQARGEMEEPLRWYIAESARPQPTSRPPTVAEVMDSFCILGDADDCVQRITAAHGSAPFTELNCAFGLGGAPEDMVRTSMTRFATEVMPRLRGLV